MSRSSRRMVMWALLIGIMVMPQAVGTDITTSLAIDDVPGAQGPNTWLWTVDTDPSGGADPTTGQYFQIDMGFKWTTDFASSVPITPSSDWELVSPTDIGSDEIIRFKVADTSASGPLGIFGITPAGPVINADADDPTGVHGPAIVPEAGTMALLGLGLFAGALLKWRKKEE